MAAKQTSAHAVERSAECQHLLLPRNNPWAMRTPDNAIVISVTFTQHYTVDVNYAKTTRPAIC